MKRVILESPFAPTVTSTIETNLRYARACIRDSLCRGEAPIASHLLYTQPGILDDGKPDERELGIAAGLVWVCVAQATVVYTDLGISRGMSRGIDAAMQVGNPIEFRSLSDWRVRR